MNEQIMLFEPRKAWTEFNAEKLADWITEGLEPVTPDTTVADLYEAVRIVWARAEFIGPRVKLAAQNIERFISRGRSRNVAQEYMGDIAHCANDIADWYCERISNQAYDICPSGAFLSYDDADYPKTLAEMAKLPWR